MLLKDGIVALGQKGASLGLIRELLVTVDVAVSSATIARFHSEMTESSNLITTTSAIQSPRRLCSERNPPTNSIRFNKTRTLKSLSTRDADAGE
jgi:hypothetical protein